MFFFFFMVSIDILKFFIVVYLNLSGFFFRAWHVYVFDLRK